MLVRDDASAAAEDKTVSSCVVPIFVDNNQPDAIEEAYPIQGFLSG
jgi:hypothetical protein